MKRCYKCGETKENIQFAKDRTRKDGLQGACRECNNKRCSEYNKTPKGKYLVHCNNAKQRGYVNDIDRNTFILITSQPCAYCGTTESLRGLDRAYNDFPYTVDNVVSCCWECNRAKASLDFKEFWALCDAVSNKRKERSSQQN